MQRARHLPLTQLARFAVSLLVTACGATQPTLRGSPQDGERAAWADEYSRARPRSSRAFDITLAAGKARDCDAEHNECFSDCWNAPPPYSHIPQQQGQHYQYCTSMCLKKYMECCKQQELRPRTFADMKAALNWLKEHKTEVLLGSVVVVAGAVFIVSTGGAGGLVLLPLAAI